MKRKRLNDNDFILGHQAISPGVHFRSQLHCLLEELEFKKRILSKKIRNEELQEILFQALENSKNLDVNNIIKIIEERIDDNQLTSATFNLNTPVSAGLYRGATLAWLLAMNKVDNLIALFNKDKDHQIFENLNLDAISKSGSAEGITLLWWLASSEQGIELASRLFESFPGLFKKCNLNAKPTCRNYSQKTVAELLSMFCAGKALLNKLKEQVTFAPLFSHPSLGNPQQKAGDQDYQLSMPKKQG